MIKAEDLEKRLNERKISSIYLLYGKEKYLIENCIKKIKNIFGECVKGINYINIDIENLQSLIDEISMPAFGYPKKLIIIKDTGLFKKEAKRKSSEISTLKNAINEYLKENMHEVKSSTILVFEEETVDKTDLYNTIESNGVVCEFPLQKPFEIKKRLKQICNLYKVNVDDSTLQYFIECCGTNMQILINEIRKLIEYTGENGTIKKEIIDILSIKQIESVIFDLTDNLGNKKVNEALEVLKNLIYNKEPIQKILITLYNHFKKLYIVKLCMKYNKDISYALNLQPNQMFLINKYKTQSKFFTEMELQNINRELIDLDYKYKIGLIDLQIGLESILCAYV